jgi:hypothetical protein
MLNRNALLFVAGAAIFALDASAGSAQDTTRTRRPTSTKRIPLTKEAPGEVVVRVDSVTVYRTDTLMLPGKTDTIIKTNTITRVDTVIPPIPRLRQIGGLYLGLAAGTAMPAADFNNSDHPGWRIEGLAGVDPVGSWLGGRLNVGYSQYSPHSFANSFLDDAKIFTVGLDAKLRVPAITPFSKRVQFYGIAGGSWNRFKDILENDHGVLTIGDGGTINGQFITVDSDWHSGWGWNLGGGVEMGWGITNIFAETRFTRFKGVNTDISHVPLVVGISWF